MIAYFGGPEGAGKTALMTKFCRIHHLMGGIIWAFPGYELKNNRGRVVSTLVNPTDVMSLIDEMQYIVLVIDEISNFMNHHAWQNPLVDVLAYGALAQRRKRQFVVLATGPFFNELPPGLAAYFHVIFNCKDMHWRNHKIPRGEKILFTETDRRGVLSGRPGFTTHPRIFRPSNYFDFYETFALVDAKYQHLRIRIKKDVLHLDSAGNEITFTHPKVITEYINDFLTARNHPDEITKYELNNFIASRLDKDYLDHQEIITLGRVMGNRGYQNNRRKALWLLPPLP